MLFLSEMDFRIPHHRQSRHHPERMTDAAVTKPEQGFRLFHIAAAFSHEVFAGVAVRQNVFQVFQIGDRLVDVNLVERCVRDINDLIAGGELVSLENFSLLSGAKGQQITQNLARFQSCSQFRFFHCVKLPFKFIFG